MRKTLAKSKKTLGNGTTFEVTLVEHTQHVVDAARALFGDAMPTHLGKQWLRFFKIPDLWNEFRLNLIAACVLHDLGKANHQFQEALDGKAAQSIRHEHLSVLLMAVPNVRQWLESAGISFPLVLSAVLTHHLKASDRRDGFAQHNAGAVKAFQLVDYQNGAQHTLNLAARELGLTQILWNSLPQVWSFEGRGQSVRDARETIQKDVLHPYSQLLRQSESQRRLLHAVRSALIAADSAGSGIVRLGNTPIDEWIRGNVTNRELLTANTIRHYVIEKRRQQMDAAGKWKNWSDFQLACDHLPERGLLLAPCGSGKTLAAWRWVATQLQNRPAGHAIFLYPTRATAREGFQDYVSWAPEADAALMHGTSDFDLVGMFENAPETDERQGRNYEAEKRLYSLAYWPRRVFSATVDQFLSFMQYGYGPMCMLPVLSDSVIVIDEVHSFDNNMFSALKDFLKAFDVPVLCMTATLPEGRRKELVSDCKLAESPEWPKDLKLVADRLRYRLQRVSDRTRAKECVDDALRNGKRVLWVVNQVRRAHEIVRSFVKDLPASPRETILTTDAGIPVVCYHSRYRLSDRVLQHRETMRLLKAASPSAALGVTTQVCEMSLDIDVDLLVTEECPISSLIQRMGRCNRDREARPLDGAGHVLVYPPESGDNLPYDKNDLTGLPEFLKLADGKDLSQTNLDELMASIPGPSLPGDKLSRFLESGPFAVGPRIDGGDGFRETADFTRPSVLASEVHRYIAADATIRPGFVLQAPSKLIRSGEEQHAGDVRFPGWLAIAPDENYHAAVGFLSHAVSGWSSQ